MNSRTRIAVQERSSSAIRSILHDVCAEVMNELDTPLAKGNTGDGVSCYSTNGELANATQVH